MKNREFYREEIIKMAKDSTFDTCEWFAKKYVFPYYGIADCNLEYCNCDFCRILQEMWLEEEYKEPAEPEVDWSKVEVDTPILVSDDGRMWEKRYFAQYIDEKVWSWEGGATSWSSDSKYKPVWWKYAKLAEKE